MSHKNYSKYSEHFNKNKEQNKNIETDNVTITADQVINGQITVDDILTEEEITKLQPEDVATVNNDGNVTGIVTDCNSLYVRKEASKESDYVAIIEKNEEVTVDLTESTAYFYKVTTSKGIEGYCMKKFIAVN